MAICPDCGRDVAEAASCTRGHFHLGTRMVPRIPYGDERRPPTWYSYDERCDDCGVEAGGHHHRDCAVEQCPLCGDYSAVCRCWNPMR
jgi:hypothetical protein